MVPTIRSHQQRGLFLRAIETILNVNGSGYSERCPPLDGSIFSDISNAISAAWKQPEISVRPSPLCVVGDAAHLSDCYLRHAEAWLGALAPNIVGVMERR